MPKPTDPHYQPHRSWPTGPKISDDVRFAVGLAHAVPGAELTIRRADGGEVMVAHREGADLNLCWLRRLVMEGAGPWTSNRWVEVVGVGGTLAPTGEGLWASDQPESKRWFATALRPDLVAAVLAELDTSDIGEEDIEVVLKPDPCLGMTAVGVSAQAPELEERRNELARRAHAACMVDELIWSAHADSTRGHRMAADSDDVTKGEQ